MELRDCLSNRKFSILSAAAFIGQHSIFPKTGAYRPDINDFNKAINFGEKSMDKLREIQPTKKSPILQLPGSYPYKKPSPSSIYPSSNRKCITCRKCAKNCPTGAIPLSNPRKTNTSLCVSCGRCVFICPENSRKFKGLLYWMASRIFTKAYAKRKEPELFYTRQ